MPTPATFLGRGIWSGFETKVLCPAPSQLGCLLRRSALGTCCAVVDPTLPGLLELFISIEISHPFSSDFLPTLSHSSVGGPHYQVSVMHSPWSEEQLVESRELCWERQIYTRLAGSLGSRAVARSGDLGHWGLSPWSLWYKERMWNRSVTGDYTEGN